MSQNQTTFKRKYLSIAFDCCNTYSRIYVNREGTAYQGRCPRCMLAVNIPIGEGGTSARAFRVSR